MIKLNKTLPLIIALLVSFVLVFTGCTEPLQNSDVVGSNSSLLSGSENSLHTESSNNTTPNPNEEPENNSSVGSSVDNGVSNNTSSTPTSNNASNSNDANTTFKIINNNVPSFSSNEITTVSFESYSNLDSLGRCGVATACIGKDIMPTEDRGEIGQVKPTGWHTVKYDIVDGKYLYNRCHLIGFQLTGENANKKNLITGTRYFNVDGMLPFENMVADYVKETNNHVMYRVTPVFEGNNLVAGGVYMEAYSVEDSGEGICFNVFVYNIQPGISIDYKTGQSSLLVTNNSQTATSSKTSSTTQSSSSSKPSSSTQSSTSSKVESTVNCDYVLNTNSLKFHKPTCSHVKKINAANRQDFKGKRQTIIDKGYEPCKVCNP